MIERISRARRDDERGFALVAVILVMMVMSALTAVMVQNIISSSNQTSRQVQVTNSLTAADAGVTDVIPLLQQSTNWSTYLTNYCTVGATGCANTINSPNQGWSSWTAVSNGQYREHVDACTVLSASRQASTGCNSQTDEVVTMQGQFPANTGAVQTVQVVLRNQAGGPAAFNYAMFADKGIQIHHHGDSYISPTIVTSSIHSNGFITLNYPAIYRVGSMEASGTITIADGGGSIPSGNVTSSYNWPYWISGSDTSNPPRCYPALQYPALSYPTGGVSNSYWAVPTGSGTSSSCSGDPQWSPHAAVVGNILANSVEIKNNGVVQQPECAPTSSVSCPQVSGIQWTPQAYGTTCGPTSQAGFTDPVTGACIPDDNANIDAGSVKFDGTGQTFTGLANATTTNVYTSSGSSTGSPAVGTGNCTGQANPCNQSGGNKNGLTTCSGCNQGSADTGGDIGGQINLHNSTWAPPSIPFPSFSFAANTLPVAEVDQGNAKTSTATCAAYTNHPECHVFSSASNFLSWMESSTNVVVPTVGGTFQGTNPCTNASGYCMVWLNSSKVYTSTPSSVAYVVLFGDYEIQGSGNLTLAENTLRSAYATGSTANTPTIMVAGALVNETGGINLTASLTVVGPTMDPFSPFLADASLPQGLQTVPGLLASGGTGTAIQSTDYDTDSPYTSTANYQGIYRNQVIVRGLVYTGSYNSSTGTSTASDQHWHNSEPKNAQTIIGAQIGGTLHDCSNFTFSYDPLIENLTGFSGSSSGGIYVVDWTQL